jgi:hypothetical protein
MWGGANNRPYGHALCVGCDTDINLSGQLHSIAVHLGNETYFLCYCDRCHLKLSRGGSEGINQAKQDAHRKLSAVDVRAAGCAVLSKVALLEHDYDPVEAYEQGTSLPVESHFAIMQGRADLTKIGGFLLVVGEEALL